MQISSGFCRITSVFVTLFLVTACSSSSDPVAEQNLQQGKAFLELNKSKQGVVALPSGLQYLVLKKGDGAQPKVIDSVRVHYRAMHIDGTEFNNSYAAGEPVTIAVKAMIPGWKKAILMMQEGDKWRLFIPQFLAYTNRGEGAVKPNEALIYEIELLKVNWMGRLPQG